MFNKLIKADTIRKSWAIYPRRSKSHIPGLMLLGLLQTALSALGIGLVIPVMTTMTKATTGNSGSILQPLFNFLGIRAVGTMAGVAVLCIVGTYFIKNLYGIFLGFYSGRVGNYTSRYLNTMLFRSFLSRPYTFHLQRNSATLINSINQEIGMAVGLITLLQVLAQELLLGIVVAGLMIYTEPFAAISTLTILVLGTLFYSRITKPYIINFGKLRPKLQEPLTRHLLQGFGGVKDIKVLGRIDNFTTQYENQQVIVQNASLRHGLLKSFGPMWTELLAMSCLSVVVWVMIWQKRPPDRIIPLLGLFVVAVWRFVPTVNSLVGLINSIRYSQPAVASVFAEFEFIKSQENLVKTQIVFKDKVEMRNLTFNYPNTVKPSLHDVNIVVRKGETIGFIGPSGAGKSTLVDVILGLLPQTSGELLIDGAEMHKHNLEWQSTIGYVSQTIYLTDDTVRGNVAFGIREDEVDEVALERALRAAQLWEFIDTLPNKTQTIVGERGVRVSGGQRQRIGIARALYHEPQVLVLDEATSSLDIGTETEVMSAVRALHGFKTILIVAHRLSTVQHCDRLYRIEDARIVAEGSFEELVKS